MSSVNLGSITPVPSEEEAAAIAAAVTMLWPQAAPAGSAQNGRANVSWRFSGRWWASSHIVRRPRPGL